MAQDFDPQDIPESLVQDASIGGYECDLFLESVGTELKCCKCKLILREPHRLICCDERVCKVSLKSRTILVRGDTDTKISISLIPTSSCQVSIFFKK